LTPSELNSLQEFATIPNATNIPCGAQKFGPNGREAHKFYTELLTFIRLFLSSRVALIAENLFLRRQLALFQERKVKPRRTTASFRLAMVALAKFFDWREALVIVKPDTFIKWHRTAFKIFWRWRSRKRGRPALPKNIRELVRQMACENPTWGEERIANELSLKLGIRVSPRTVGKYLECGQPRGSSGQRWSTFVRNHANAMVACDFFASVTANFRIPYVFVAMEVDHAGFCTATSLSTRPPSGPPNSSANSWRSIIPTDS
jgi:putative transposase